MRNKSSSFKKMMMVAMKNISTLVLVVGAMFFILSVLFPIIGYDKVGLEPFQLFVGSVVVMILGAAGEDVFGGFLYNYWVQNEA